MLYAHYLQTFFLFDTKNHDLRTLMKQFNVLLTPHVGYVSSETYEKFYQGYVDVILSFVDGKPINLLN